IDKIKTDHLKIDIQKTNSQMGSGTLPLIEIPSVALTVKSDKDSPQKLVAKLRENQPPIIGYIRD
ncbi:MAG: hypothetical protein GWN16_03475, partial [Calditrichae bacterium]|nr:hypothetical protein [Calditrichia bacterium]